MADGGTEFSDEASGRRDSDHLDVDEVLHRLNSSRRGLSQSEAGRRLARYGPNELREEGRHAIWPLIFRQVADRMTLILITAAGIAWVSGDALDAGLIAAIVLINGCLGFLQEYRAERALAALKRVKVPQAMVWRDERLVRLGSSELVPGDVVAVEAGDRVPADGRLIDAARLTLDESMLTGESVPVTKHVDRLSPAPHPIGDRLNIVFAGTSVVTGRGTAVVTATGMATELGKIAHLLETVEDGQTPLQRRLAALGNYLAGAVGGIAVVFFIAGLARGESAAVMLLTAISLAVAAIPEALPAVVAIVLALGAQRMAKRNALVRTLPAVETLGSVTTICSDKTGTLTQNIMAVGMIATPTRLFTVTGSGYRPEGAFGEGDRAVDPAKDEGLLQILRAAALCTDARLQQRDGSWTIAGDPTEGALLVAAAKAGLWKETLEAEAPRVAEIPFDADRRRMTTVHRNGQGRLRLLMKGGVDEVLSRCESVFRVDGADPLTESLRNRIAGVNRDLAGDGVRVLACAMRALQHLPAPEDLERAEQDLVFLGLVGLLDPPRPEVTAAVARCREAGIRPIMITGDHRLTAEAIAAQLGIKGPDDRVLTGGEVEARSDSDLEHEAGIVSVYARVSPEQKVRIVRALKCRGEIVAMTGDGVNDAPALRVADIGVSMGRGGTDVAREASQIVLLDDHFATIVSAVEEGRVIYDNIRKFTRYILATNAGELLTMVFAMLLGFPLPLLPIQLLWINLLSDGLPALALGVEPAERTVMQRPPRPPRESLFAGGLGWHIVWVGLVMGIGTIAVFHWASDPNDLRHGQTMAFFTLTAFQIFHVLAIRSERDAVWTIGLWSNPHLMAAILATMGLQVAVTYVGPLQVLFHTTALSFGEVAVCVGTASAVYFAVEAEKWWRYRRVGTPFEFSFTRRS